VASIRKYYPDVAIAIADDSECAAICTTKTMHKYALPFDVGLSAGRNYLVDRIETPYTVMLDDDFVFTEQTDLERWLHAMKRDKYALIGGCCVRPDGREQHYEGYMVDDRKRRALRLIRLVPTDLAPVHITLNFFIAQTSILRAVRWDERFKVGEHEDFFWRLSRKFRVGYDPHVRIVHHRGERSKRYQQHRNKRAHNFQQEALAKHGWDRMYWVKL